MSQLKSVYARRAIELAVSRLYKHDSSLRLRVTRCPVRNPVGILPRDGCGIKTGQPRLIAQGRIGLRFPKNDV